MDQHPKRSRLDSDAETMLLYGTPPEEVRDWLCAQGVAAAEADEMLAGAFLQRTRELRARGIWDLAIPVPVCVFFAAAIVALWPPAYPYTMSRVIAIFILIEFYCIVRFIRGIAWLLGLLEHK